VSIKSNIARLAELEKKAELGGGLKRIEVQHAKGKLTARERIAILVDEGSFVEMDKIVTHRCYDFGLDKKKMSFLVIDQKNLPHFAHP